MLGVLSFVATACGDDDDAGEGDASGTPTTEASGSETTEAAATEPPVTIAVLSDETGASALSIFGVVEAAAEALNSEGGINGHPIELQLLDMRSDTPAAQAAVGEIADDAIAVLLNSPTSEATIGDSLAALGMPILGVGYQPVVWGGNLQIFGLTCAASGADYCAKPNFFTTAPGIETTVGMQLVGAQNVGATRVTSASCTEVVSCTAAEPIFVAIAEDLGLEVTEAVRVSSTAADYSSECVGFIQDEIDFVQISGSPAMATQLQQSCADQGFEGTFGASAGSVTAEVLAGQGQLSGGLNGFPWFVDDPLVERFREIMDAGGVSEDEYSNPHATGMYANLLLLKTAIEEHADAAAPLDAAAALAAMYQVNGEDLDGLLAEPVTFTEDDLDRTLTCYWPYIKDADGNVSNPEEGLNTQCYPEAG
jgi:branched-chain amino acid transport system substrate-binding protein